MTSEGLGSAMVTWLATYWLHSTVLIVGVWLFSRWRHRQTALLDLLWKVAIVGGVITATVQVAAGFDPIGGRISLAGAATHAATLTAVPTESARALSYALATDSASGAASSAWSGWPQFLAGVWLLLASALMVSLGLGWARLRRRLRGRQAVGAGPTRALLERLREEARLKAEVALSTTPRLLSPVAMGLWRREICLPARALTELPEDCQRGLLAHELAHHVRRDPAWRLIAGILSRLFFFQPLNRVAARNLERCSEVLCDDFAAARERGGLAMARCLAQVAEWVVGQRRLRSAYPSGPLATMAVDRGGLRDRVQRLLGDERSSSLGRTARPACVAAVALLALAVPGVSIGAAPPPSAGDSIERAVLPERTLAVASLNRSARRPAGTPSAKVTVGVKRRARQRMKQHVRRRHRSRHRRRHRRRVIGFGIGRKVQAALANIPSALDLEKRIRGALKGFSAKKIRIKIRDSLKRISGRKLGKLVSERVSKALESIPSGEKIARIVSVAIQSVPSVKKIEGIVGAALKAIPNVEKISEAVGEAVEVIEHVFK